MHAKVVVLVLLVACLLFVDVRAKRSPPSYCGLPSKVGPCKGHMPRYFYHAPSRLCKKFIYGGCESREAQHKTNKNRFKTMAACMNTCKNYSVPRG